MVTHANLIHNETVIKTACEHDDSTVFAGWLPFYHDMGLIGNIFQPLFLGVKSVLMSPMTFLVDRRRSGCGRSRSFGPRRAAGRTSRTSSACTGWFPEEIEGVDLSSWRIAFNGAEPVKAHVIDGVHSQVRVLRVPCRGVLSLLRARREHAVRDRWRSCGAGRHTGASIRRSCARTERWSSPDRPTVLVGCGRTNMGQSVVIVDPESLRVLPEGHVGRDLAVGWLGHGRVLGKTRADRRDLRGANRRRRRAVHAHGRSRLPEERSSCSSRDASRT